MKKYLMIAAAVLAIAAPVSISVAQADMHAEHAAEVAPVEHTLQDGTKVVVKGDAVFVVGADGTETAAPDGVHTLADGTTLTTQGGLVVPAAPAAQ